MEMEKIVTTIIDRLEATHLRVEKLEDSIREMKSIVKILQGRLDRQEQDPWQK